jgi:hypothetical protein
MNTKVAIGRDLDNLFVVLIQRPPGRQPLPDGSEVSHET